MNKSITLPNFFLSSSSLAKVFGKIPFKEGFLSSIALIALSIVVPFSAEWAFLAITSQRASGGTKKTLTFLYSSISSFHLPPSSFKSSLYLSSNLSDKYFKKIKPNTTCLYSAASIEPLSSSAASQICFSNPISELFSFTIKFHLCIIYLNCFISPKFTLC